MDDAKVWEDVVVVLFVAYTTFALLGLMVAIACVTISRAAKRKPEADVNTMGDEAAWVPNSFDADEGHYRKAVDYGGVIRNAQGTEEFR